MSEGRSCDLQTASTAWRIFAPACSPQTLPPWDRKRLSTTHPPLRVKLGPNHLRKCACWMNCQNHVAGNLMMASSPTSFVLLKSGLKDCQCFGN